MQKVVVIQKSLPQYRIEFFNELKKELSSKNIELQLIYGDSHIDDRKDTAVCEWATFKKNKTIQLGSYHAIWQPCTTEISTADLIIVEQANRLLLNYFIIYKKLFGKRKFAYWSHGHNFKAVGSKVTRMVSSMITKLPDWWFVYTDGVKQIIADSGVKEQHITVVQNAIDTKSLSKLYDSIPEEEVNQLKQEYDVQPDERVLIFCGALSKAKNIEFLIQAADQLSERKYRFKLFVIGSGPDSNFVQDAAKSRPWLKFLGAKFGRDKAKIFKLSDIFLLPGAVGLAILDAFAFETPMITIEASNHGPEIEYLVDGYNGVMSKPEIPDYVGKIANLLDHPEVLEKLKSACRPMIEKYNIQQMVSNFSSGIEKALKN